MAEIKDKLIKLLNEALKLEHAAENQYLSQAELVNGLYAEKIIERLTEIASDEAKHQKQFRTLIGDYLNAEPTTGIAETHHASNIEQILKVNIADEKHAVDVYKNIYATIIENKENLPYIFETLEHEIRHIIIDEEEHIVELTKILG